MSVSSDDVVQEKRSGLKASWELPTASSGDMAASRAGGPPPSGSAQGGQQFETNHEGRAALGADEADGSSTSYENKHVSYPTESAFEVKREPGRLG